MSQSSPALSFRVPMATLRDELTKAVSQHGRARIMVFSDVDDDISDIPDDTVVDGCIVRKATRPEYSRFVDKRNEAMMSEKGQPVTADMDILVASCIAYPDRAGVRSLLDYYAAATAPIVSAVIELSGGKPKKT